MPDPGRKRSSSSTKNISLELVYKSGGLEQKVTLSPSVSHSRKLSVDWLRALKKVLSCKPVNCSLSHCRFLSFVGRQR